MICVSKADERSLRHLTFNQSPGPLAAEHTTRQDMNGISNLREHVAADQDDDSGGGLLSSADADEKWHHEGLSPGLGQPPHGAGRWSYGPSSCLQPPGGDDQPGLSVISQASLARLWGWITWTASVLLVSFLLSSYSAWTAQSWTSNSAEAPAPVQPSHSAPAQELTVQHFRKRDSCASGGADADEYNTVLHVGALLIIWFVSSLSCAFPLLAKKFPGLHIPKRFFFFVRHFGTGVLIATAFVHLLPTAFISLGNPCLGGFWVNDYPAMPGAIALASIFFVTVLEMVFHPSRKCTSIQVAPAQSNEEAVEDTDETAVSDERPEMPMRDMQPPRARSSSVGHGLNRLTTVEEEAERGRAQSKGETDARPSLESVTVLSPEQKLRKERLQCVLLELGILFHSIFIGMALSVSVGNEFIILLIAIVFHQTFEGLALGSRISMVKWPVQNKHQPWLMAMAYGMTTPLGQAIGIATHTLYSPDSEVGLIVVGVMNSISAGLLTFASLVELMSEDFLSDESWQYLRGKRRVVACLFVLSGAFAMSLVGAWA